MPAVKPTLAIVSQPIVANALELAGSALLVGGVAVGQLRRRRRLAPTASVAVAVAADAAASGASDERGIAASDRGVDPIPAVQRRS